MEVSEQNYGEIADQYGWSDAPTVSQVPDVFYHYTDAAGLIGILSSGVVRASDYRFLNDFSEVLYTDSLVRELIAERLKSSTAPTLNLLYSSLLEARTFLPEEELVHIFSMTEEADSLSQWRAYARNGRGFAIGFDAKEIAKLAEDEAAQFGLRRVIYEENVQKKPLSEAVEALEAKYRKDISRRVSKEYLIGEVQEAIKDLTVYRGSTNKHKAFSGEREWRLVGFPEKASEVKVRARGQELVPFLEFSLGDGGRLPISRVGVGPGFSAGNQRQAAELLCKQFGYKPEVYLADAPFRAS